MHTGHQNGEQQGCRPQAARSLGTSTRTAAFLPPWVDQNWVAAALLVAAVFVTYLPVFQAGFLWDDDSHLTHNPCVVGPLGIKDIWTSTEARICPLTLSSFWLQHAIWGLRPLPYHLLTLLLDASAAVVLWRVLVGLKVPGAWLGAALWALHPVQVESVAWITELKNTQSGLFYVLTGLFFVRARLAEQAPDTKRARVDDWLALGFGTLAMASKSSTVILPLALGLCGWWVERRWRWRLVPKLAPYFVLAVLSSSVALWTESSDCAEGPEWVRSWPERFVTAGRVVWFYLGKLLWPCPLMFIYPRWETDARPGTAYLPLALVLVTLVVLWLGRNGWSRGLFMAFAYFLAALLPVLGLFNHYFLRYSFVGDHFQYLASIGPLALAGAGIWRGVEWAGNRKGVVRAILGGLLLGGLGIMTWMHAQVFRDNETLWQDTLAKNPGAWMAHLNWGCALADQQKAEAAIEHFQAVLRIKPGDADAQNNLGTVLAAQGKTDEAIRHYLAALQAKPNNVNAHNNLAAALSSQGKVEEAIAHYRTALQLNPRHAEAHFNLGALLDADGKTDEAQAHYLAAVQAKPEAGEAYNNLSSLFAGRGDAQQALRYATEAVRLRPNYAQAHYNLGNALGLQGKISDAAAEYAAAARLKPDYAEAHYNLGGALFLLGQVDEAAAHLSQAVRLQPANAAAHSKLAVILDRQGKTGEAVGQYQEALRIKPNLLEALRNLAWIRATYRDAPYRNGAEAVRLAQQAAQLTQEQDAAALDILAAAYAESGDFAHAVATSERALALATAANQASLREQILARQEQYRSGQPCRQ